MSRLQAIATLAAVLWGVVSLRAAWLVADGTELRSAALRQRFTHVAIESTPGQLVDRRGRVLAISGTRPSVFVDPSRIDDPAEFAAAVAPIVSADADELAAALRRHRTQRFRWLRRLTTPQTVERLRELALPERTWGVREERDRFYPQGIAAAHLLGFRDIDHAAKSGLEKRYAAAMTAEPGERAVVRDARGRSLAVLQSLTKDPSPGQTIRLSIDAAVQAIAARELDRLVDRHRPRWAAAVVIDVERSELVASETRPTFDPNDPQAAAANGLNHAFATAFEPGSTMKPFVVARAVDDKLASPDEMVDCGDGEAAFGGRTVRDSHPVGRVPLGEVLVESSNIGVSRLVGRFDRRALWETFDAVGFGRVPRVQPPLGRTGRLRPVSGWTDYSPISHGIGYELTVTPVQLAMAYAIIARDGRDAPLSLLHDAAIETQPRRVFTSETCRWLRTGPLADVVSRGTARAAALPGVPVWGKTGTAQRFDPVKKVYRTDRATAVFAGGIPAERPRYVAVVVADDPAAGGGGGRVAAPAAIRILRDTDRMHTAGRGSHNADGTPLPAAIAR